MSSRLINQTRETLTFGWGGNSQSSSLSKGEADQEHALVAVPTRCPVGLCPAARPQPILATKWSGEPMFCCRWICIEDEPIRMAMPSDILAMEQHASCSRMELVQLNRNHVSSLKQILVLFLWLWTGGKRARPHEASQKRSPRGSNKKDLPKVSRWAHHCNTTCHHIPRLPGPVITRLRPSHMQTFICIRFAGTGAQVPDVITICLYIIIYIYRHVLALWNV